VQRTHPILHATSGFPSPLDNLALKNCLFGSNCLRHTIAKLLLLLLLSIMSDQSAPSLGNVKLSAKRKRPHIDSDAEDDDQMCAFDARKVYAVNDKDLSTLVCDLAPNPYDLHGASAPMRLYKVNA
jgi:hypothetical protein